MPNTAAKLQPVDPVKARFGRVVNKLRNERKAHSLRSLGEALGVTAKYVWEIENGIHIPSDEIIQRIAGEFRISEAKLFKIAKRIHPKVRTAIERDGDMADVIAHLVAADDSTLAAVREILAM